MRKAVFLDRDGVINRSLVRGGKPYAPVRLEEFEILPGVPEALLRLRAAGFLNVVVTNQPDLTTGKQSPGVLAAMHSRLMAELAIDAIRVCPHVETDNCACRKPRPGLLLDAARDLGIDLASSCMVGDRWRDVAAGQRAGCGKSFFIDYEYAEKRPEKPYVAVKSLSDFVDRILSLHAPQNQGSSSMPDVKNLKVKLFADGADLAGIKEMAANPRIAGFTTNPTLMRKAGIADYKAFAQQVLEAVGGRPLALEVFADAFDEMEKQALEIASWGKNINVKIPVTNTKGEFCGPLVERLSRAGVQVNVTAVMTLDQVKRITERLAPETPAIVSVFAGRVADTGRDPVPLMAEAVKVLKAKPRAELIWASPRELLNIFQADEIGCQIITATNDILKKLSLVGKDLDAYSLETVDMFYKDAKSAGYTIAVPAA